MGMERPPEDRTFEVLFDHLDGHRLLRATLRGPTGLQDLLSVGPLLHRHAAFPAVDGVLYDLRGIEPRFEVADLRALAARVEARDVPRGYRVAYLAADDLLYGMTRVFEALVDGLHDRERRAFRDEAEALAWLGDAPPRRDPPVR